jgi:hypothetical protein
VPHDFSNNSHNQGREIKAILVLRRILLDRHQVIYKDLNYLLKSEPLQLFWVSWGGLFRNRISLLHDYKNMKLFSLLYSLFIFYQPK